MASPVQQHKLARGAGRLVRYTANGPWSWQHWDRRLKRWILDPTHEVNRSKAEQFAYQQMAVSRSKVFRYQGLPILFSTVAEVYLKKRSGNKKKDLRPSSIKKCRTALNAFKVFAGSGYDSLLIDRVDGDLLSHFVQHEARRVSADTANFHLDVVRQVLRFALKRHQILTCPGDDVERAQDDNAPSTMSRGLHGYPCPTAEQVRLILDIIAPTKKLTAKRADNGSTKGRSVYRGINANDYTDLLTSICLSGMRIDEARHLTWDDIDFSSRIILIRAGYRNGVLWQPKSQLSNRRIPIVLELEEILRRLERTNKSHLWVFETRRGTQIHAHNVGKRFRTVCDSLGFKEHFVVHSLRKYWASTMAQQGVDPLVLTKMLGHSDHKLVVRTYYAQNDDARMVRQADTVDFGLSKGEVA